MASLNDAQVQLFMAIKPGSSYVRKILGDGGFCSFPNVPDFIGDKSEK